jgi:hypothetical protein
VGWLLWLYGKISKFFYIINFEKNYPSVCYTCNIFFIIIFLICHKKMLMLAYIYIYIVVFLFAILEKNSLNVAINLQLWWFIVNHLEECFVACKFVYSFIHETHTSVMIIFTFILYLKKVMEKSILQIKWKEKEGICSCG